MNLTFLPDVLSIPLNRRPGYDQMIRSGSPQAFGRIVAVSEDRRTARVVWRGTPGTFSFVPDARTIDVAVIVKGRLIVRVPGQPVIHAAAGSLIEFPREPFELEILEEFTKVSFLYHPERLQLEVEPLSESV